MITGGQDKVNMLQESRCHFGHNWVVCLVNFPLWTGQKADMLKLQKNNYDEVASSLN